MSSPAGFTAVRAAVITALLKGAFEHEARGDIDVKNKLQTGEVTALQLVTVIKRASGASHSSSPHHFDRSVVVHVIRSQGWYVKFYFIDPKTVFISVHQ